MDNEPIPVVIDTTEFVLIRLGLDDVFDGQLCRVISRPDARGGQSVEVECWTGYRVWTQRDNLIPIQGDAIQLMELFRLGRTRTDSGVITF